MAIRLQRGLEAGKVGLRFISAILAFILVTPLLHAAGDSLVWSKRQQQVDADIRSWDVRELLGHVAAATGWKVYLDPEAIHQVSVKFKKLSPGEALHSMLGDLNFVVVPQTNASSRLYVFRTTQSQATRLIAPIKKPAQPIPNELVVTLKPDSKLRIEDLARSLNAKIIGRMDSQHAYLLQFQDDAASQAASVQLANNPDVANVGANYPIDAPPALTAAESANPALQLKPKGNLGNKIIVGLIDTPVQSLGAGLDAFILPQIHVAGDVQDSTSLTHGTAMMETIIDGLQKVSGTTSVQIQPVDVYGNSESTSTFDVANGIVQAVNSGANIINLSLGGTGDSQVLHDTIAKVAQQGIPIYAAAGNDPVTTPTYPAAYPEVISVTATDSSGNLASYANRGTFVDMTAPGDNVVGFNGLNYLVEGTSTSTAFVSGTAAALADTANAPASQAESLLQKSLPKSAILKAPQ